MYVHRFRSSKKNREDRGKRKCSYFHLLTIFKLDQRKTNRKVLKGERTPHKCETW